jgi:hypothetical protein
MAQTVNVPINRDNAVLLLAAAKELGQPSAVVKTTTNGHFIVPQEVAEKADFGARRPAAAKKAAAKKTTAAAKKTAAKEQE